MRNQMGDNRGQGLVGQASRLSKDDRQDVPPRLERRLLESPSVLGGERPEAHTAASLSPELALRAAI